MKRNLTLLTNVLLLLMMIAAVSSTACHDTRNKAKTKGLHINSYDTEDPIEVGCPITYVVEGRNDWEFPVSGVRMVNELSPKMKFLEATGPAPYRYDESRHEVIFEPLQVLKPGQKVVYRITCCAVAQGSCKIVCTMSCKQFARSFSDTEGTSAYR